MNQPTQTPEQPPKPVEITDGWDPTPRPNIIPEAAPIVEPGKTLVSPGHIAIKHLQ